jgi:flagellar hook-associated protein 1 FlgK
MSLGAALNSALHGLRASQIALAVASNNISNAETPGYTRQRAILAQHRPVATDFGWAAAFKFSEQKPRAIC